jgi:NAD(P)-dependent dehydrogenase (short-subunit alcohol dehydrogenase family)
VAKRMVEAKIAGSLIHTTSQMAFTTGPGRTAYCASKAAVEAFSRGIALELAPHGIRSNTLAPTFIETPMSKPFLEDKALKDFVMAKIKLGRIGQVEDLTGAIVYLASDASSLMTGTHMLIDGGWTLG